MSDEAPPFSGFPGLAKATAIPNVFFSLLLPRMRAPGDLLAFLWIAKLVQEMKSETRFCSASQVWAEEGAAEAFAEFGGGEPGLAAGLDRCVEIGALLRLDLVGENFEESIYFINNPGSRRAVGRARAGELVLRPETYVRPPQADVRPGVFRLYEENIGLITPLIGERLLAAAEEYPWEWIEDAIREAVELNRRNWRYIERILQNWMEGGRSEGVARSAPPSARDARGGPVARYR